ncbi:MULTISPECIES: hypothetical protein [Colwellia]|uniref:Alginate export domain-containing protein n=1 Tax=Colwellia marinimaniae TaxID=1513592 RepID=A0ABQ0MXU5_9GAMM|nr:MULTISPECIES: hypothetical protein [Colwellia]GAW97202.1 hypothetical protein MTCD1_02828 [Colwellia marinimaniae]
MHRTMPKIIRKTMRKTINIALITLLAGFTGVSFAEAESKEQVADKYNVELPGKHELAFRSRYQSTHDDWWQDANAFTTRVKLTSSFTLDDNEQWQLLLQPNYVFVHNDNYNSISQFNRKSVIPDTQGGSLSQGYLAFSSNNNWQIKAGRQSLSYDNERMVGALEYWQTPQSFDAISAQYNDQMNWHIQYAYVDKVQRIFGRHADKELPADDPRNGYLTNRPTSEWGEHQLKGHFINMGYKTENNWQLVVYNYLIDNRDQASFSSNTVGIRIADEFKPNSIKYRYNAEFAWQEDAYNNTDNYQAWYNLVAASIQYKSHIFQLSQETFSQDQGIGFKSSLGTNHKFQGWADVFTSYSGQKGLRDTFFTYRGRHKKLRWRFVYHDFNTYGTGQEIGYEFDFELAYRLTRKWQIKAVYADYRSKDTWTAEYLAANFDLSTWFISVSYNI